MDFNAYQQTLATELRGRECPFPEAEYQQRLKHLRASMHADGLGAVLLTDPSDLFYLTGYSTFEVSVHVALVVTADTLTLQVPSIETGPAMVTTRVDHVIGYRWEGVGDVLDPLAHALIGHGGKVGVDYWHGSLRQGVLEGLKLRLPDTQFVDASGLLKSIRIVKSAAEIDCLRHSARITGQGIEAAAAAIRPGMTDNEIAAIGAESLLAGGSEFMSMQPIVTVGLRSSVIHTNHKRCRIEDGDTVFLEFGAAWQRYTAPMMRTLVAGHPSARMRAVFDGCRRVVDVLKASMVPGRTFDSAARAAEQVWLHWPVRCFSPGCLATRWGRSFLLHGWRAPVL